MYNEDKPRPVLLEPKAIIDDAKDQCDKMRAIAMEAAQQAVGEAEKHEGLAKAFREASHRWFDLAGVNPEPSEGKGMY